MTGRSVIHDTFTIERSYRAAPCRVFAAFTSAEARNAWGDLDGVEEAGSDAAAGEFDYRIGGHERFGFRLHGINYRYRSHYYDLVPDQRIVYAYEMYADDARISVSVATIEFTANGDSTTVAWTEQGAYLDGIDGPAAPGLRREGTAELLDNLTGYLNSAARALASRTPAATRRDCVPAG